MGRVRAEDILHVEDLDDDNNYKEMTNTRDMTNLTGCPLRKMSGGKDVSVFVAVSVTPWSVLLPPALLSRVGSF